MNRTLLFPATLVAFLSACGGSDDDVGGVRSTSIYQPEPGVTFHWQLQGTINTGVDVDIYDIDLEDTDESTIADLQAAGRKVICYFSAGSYEEWRADEADFPAAVRGNDLDDWEGEQWLDIRSDDVREIMAARLDMARDKGCDGVEPDNVDGYSNDTGFPLTYADQLSYNRFLASEAHDRNLSIALKNDLDQIEDLVDDFDFAVNEECYQYDECDALAPFIDADKAVLHVEYDETLQSDSVARQTFCSELSSSGLSSTVLPLALDGTYAFPCWD